MEIGPLVSATTVHAVLEQGVVDEVVADDLLDIAQVPKDRVARVLDEERHTALEQVPGDFGADEVDGVG